MNVSELSDVELNRAMIWCYGPMWMCSHEKYRDQGQVVVESALTYLTDYNLTMPLAFEHELEIEFMPMTRASEGYDGTSYSNKNPLRAICEVLIMIAMEKKG